MPLLFSTKKLACSKNTLGDLLKNTRLRHKLKLHHIEQFTNIRRSYIVAIENNQWDKLPSFDYAQKFILTYAKFLELDLVKIKNRINIELGNSQPETANDPQKKSNSIIPIITPRTITITLVSLLLLFAGIFSYYQINHFIQTPKLTVNQPPDYTEVSVNKIDISGQTDPDNIIYINNQPLTTDKNGNFSAPIQLKEGYNIINVTAKNKIGKSITATKVIIANLDNSSTISNNNFDLTISADNEDIWIRVKLADDQIIFDGTIYTGNSENFTIPEAAYLTTTNAGQTTVQINGKNLGPLGQENEIIEDLKISNQPNISQS